MAARSAHDAGGLLMPSSLSAVPWLWVLVGVIVGYCLRVKLS